MVPVFMATTALFMIMVPMVMVPMVMITMALSVVAGRRRTAMTAIDDLFTISIYGDVLVPGVKSHRLVCTNARVS